MKKCLLFIILIILVSGCSMVETIKSVNENAKTYINNGCQIFYPDNYRVEEYAKNYCDNSEIEEVIDYSLIEKGDFLRVVYPDGKEFLLNKDYSDIKLEIFDKKMLSELFIYEFKKSEDDRAYTSDFLFKNHYSNITISDFMAEFIDDKIIIKSLVYDFSFNVDFGYSKALFNADFGEYKEYIKPIYVSKNRPVVALTYDDGPYRQNDKQLFDLYDLYDSRCTFFIVGNRINENELESIKEGISLNNEYGSHTNSHDDIRGIQKEIGVDTFIKPMNILKDELGYEMKIYRQPYGYRNKELEQSLKDDYQLTSVLWNVDSLDWKTRDEESTYNWVLNDTDGGDVVLMHCLYQSTIDASKRIVPELIDKGYQLVTCFELMNILEIEDGPVYGR